MLAIWTATGNSLSNLPRYLQLSGDVAAGFAGAMSVEQGNVHEWYYAAGLLACLVAALGLGLRLGPRRARFCAWLLFLGFTWTALKEGFVRNDGTHTPVFFTLMMVALIAVPWPRPLGGHRGRAGGPWRSWPQACA